MELHSITFPGLPEPYKVAPGGYGLGDANGMETLVDLGGINDVATKPGWYKVAFSLNSISNWTLRVDTDGTNIFQEYKGIYNGVELVMHRSKTVGGSWGELEWDNPPMVLGVEYRTTERWNGKAVYTKLIDLGALPNNTEKNVTHGIANLENALSISAFAKSADWQFTLPSSYAAETKIVFAPQSITITTTVDRSMYNGYATLKYTKSV